MLQGQHRGSGRRPLRRRPTRAGSGASRSSMWASASARRPHPWSAPALALAFGWTTAFSATTVGMVDGPRPSISAAASGSCRGPPLPIHGGRRPSRALGDPAVSEGHGWVLLGIGLCAVSVWISYEQQANAMIRWVSGATGGRGASRLSWLQSIPPATVILGTPHSDPAVGAPSRPRAGALAGPQADPRRGPDRRLPARPARPCRCFRPQWMSGTQLAACLRASAATWRCGRRATSISAPRRWRSSPGSRRGGGSRPPWRDGISRCSLGSLISGWIGGFWGVIAPATLLGHHRGPQPGERRRLRPDRAPRVAPELDPGSAPTSVATGRLGMSGASFTVIEHVWIEHAGRLPPVRQALAARRGGAAAGPRHPGIHPLPQARRHAAARRRHPRLLRPVMATPPSGSTCAAAASRRGCCSTSTSPRSRTTPWPSSPGSPPSPGAAGRWA